MQQSGARIPDSSEGFSELAVRIRELSAARWGAQRDTPLAGLHARMLAAQHRLLVCAQADSPVLITGETGTGKELFARAMHLLSRRRAAPYLCVNCAQYQEGQLVASELFGHRRGSFTGAVADHRGIFEEAEGGIVFLDEIAELSAVAQAMLLRTLSEGEILPVGESRARPVNVRVFAATGRDLKALVARGLFREDLYYRLRYLHVAVPALRERGDDWEIIAAMYLRALASHSGSAKTLSPAARRHLGGHRWPGNVRELRSVVETGYHLSNGSTIEPDDFATDFDDGPVQPVGMPTPVNVNAFVAQFPSVVRERDAVSSAAIDALYRGMVDDRKSFWTLVYDPFMARDLSRADARAIVERGLFESRGSYKRLLAKFGIEGTDYLRFMDFLRHHRLKPARLTDSPAEAPLPLSHGASDWEAQPGDGLADV